MEKDKLRNWMHQLIRREKHNLLNLNIIYCDDNFLRRINREYLNHDFYTDIITFDNSDKRETINGDIYISIDRVTTNSITYGNTFRDELHRVMAHGVLHLVGYGDKNNMQRSEMKKKEDYWLEKRRFSTNDSK